MKKRFLINGIILLLFLSSCQTLDYEEVSVDLYNIAVELQKNGNLDRALLYYEYCLEQEEPPLQAYYNVTLIYITQGKWPRADRSLAQLEEIDPQNRNLLRLRLYLQYSRYLTESTDSTEKDDSVEADTLEADTLEADSLEADSVEVGSVEADSVEADSVEADSVEADSVEESQGQALEINEDAQNIIDTARQILEIYPKDSYALEVLSMLYQKLEQPDEALFYLSQIEQADMTENSFNLYYNLLQQKEESEELRSWLFQNRNHALTKKEHLYSLIELNAAASLYEENRNLLERMLTEYPEDKSLLLFKLANLQLSEFSLWEEGLRNLRLSFISGYNSWSEVESMASSLNPALKNEVLNLMELYKWE